MMPDLYSEHEGFSRHRRNVVGNRVVSTESRKTRTDDNFFKGADDFVIESHQQGNDDADREKPSEEGAVLGLGSEPEEFCSVEEIKFVDDFLEATPTAHESNNRVVVIIDLEN